MSQLLQCPVCWIEQFNTLGWPFGDAEEARRFVSMFPLTFKATDVTCRCGATFPAVVHTKFDGRCGCEVEHWRRT